MADALRPDHLAYWRRLVAERDANRIAMQSYGRFLADEYAQGGNATLLDDGTLVPPFAPDPAVIEERLRSLVNEAAK